MGGVAPGATPGPPHPAAPPRCRPPAPAPAWWPAPPGSAGRPPDCPPPPPHRGQVEGDGRRRQEGPVVTGQVVERARHEEDGVAQGGGGGGEDQALLPPAGREVAEPPGAPVQGEDVGPPRHQAPPRHPQAPRVRPGRPRHLRTRGAGEHLPSMVEVLVGTCLLLLHLPCTSSSSSTAWRCSLTCPPGGRRGGPGCRPALPPSSPGQSEWEEGERKAPGIPVLPPGR